MKLFIKRTLMVFLPSFILFTAIVIFLFFEDFFLFYDNFEVYKSLSQKLTAMYGTAILFLGFASLLMAHQHCERKHIENFMKRQCSAYARFVPSEFLHVLNRESLAKVELCDCAQKELTVSIADIRSYTKMTENLSHEEIFDLLNNYSSHLNLPVLKNNGFVFKFIGDALMSLFPNSPADAVAAAIEMHRALKLYNLKHNSGSGVQLKAGFGIHYGKLTLGTIGSHDRMETAVIGDTVNLASQLESVTKIYNADIILSESVYENLPDSHPFHIRKIDTVKLKGIQQPVSLYEVFDTNEAHILEQKIRFLPKFQEAMEYYKKGTFDNALELFRECQKSCPMDSILLIYVRRCSTMKRVPPGPNWAGISSI
jgi:class 3 adenylate cyclase